MPVTHWTWDPTVVLALAAAAVAYGVAVWGRSASRPRRLGWEQIAAYYAGLTLLTFALVSPLDSMSDRLFSAHMVQHLLIGLVAPLLIVLGHPFAVTSQLSTRETQRNLQSILRPARRALHFRPSSVAWSLAAVTAHVAVWWVWHTPPFYDAAVRNDAIHAFEHVTLFATGAAFWWVLVATRWRERSGAAVLYLFVAALASGALAALLTLAPHSLYSVHATTTAPWNLTPLEDQELAGAIMWVPGGTVYVGAALVLFIRWLQASSAGGRPLDLSRAVLAGRP